MLARCGARATTWSPDQFAALTDKLWKQVEPLYVALHTYVRWKLNAKYGDAVQAKTGRDPRRSARQYVGAGMGQYL